MLMSHFLRLYISLHLRSTLVRGRRSLVVKGALEARLEARLGTRQRDATQHADASLEPRRRSFSKMATIQARRKSSSQASLGFNISQCPFFFFRQSSLGPKRHCFRYVILDYRPKRPKRCHFGLTYKKKKK